MSNINNVKKGDVVVIDSSYQITIEKIDAKGMCICVIEDGSDQFEVELPADVLCRSDDPPPVEGFDYHDGLDD